MRYDDAGVPSVPRSSVPWISARQMRDIDDLAVGTFGISLIQMMENAGRSLAEFVLDRYRPDTVTVLVGPGHNGGGGLVTARHLRNRGVDVAVTLTRATDLSPVTARQLNVVRAIGVPVCDDPRPSSVIVDAMIGYSLVGTPTGRTGELIEWANQQPTPVVALDVPSGVDASKGRVDGSGVCAHATMTLALPKIGLAIAAQMTGELFLADISIPAEVYRVAKLDVPILFHSSPIVRIVENMA